MNVDRVGLGGGGEWAAEEHRQDRELEKDAHRARWMLKPPGLPHWGPGVPGVPL